MGGRRETWMEGRKMVAEGVCRREIEVPGGVREGKRGTQMDRRRKKRGDRMEKNGGIDSRALRSASSLSLSSSSLFLSSSSLALRSASSLSLLSASRARSASSASCRARSCSAKTQSPNRVLPSTC